MPATPLAVVAVAVPATPLAVVAVPAVAAASSSPAAVATAIEFADVVDSSCPIYCFANVIEAPDKEVFLFLGCQW